MSEVDALSGPDPEASRTDGAALVASLAVAERLPDGGEVRVLSGIAARQAAEQAQFEAWRDGLSPDELADALRGHPGGPRDAWLKKVWRDRRS